MEMLIRPNMPTEDDQARSEHLADRLLVLKEEHEEIAHDWMKGIIPEIVLESWGPPDLAVNPLAELALQLSTPGLYGSAPSLDNAGGVEQLSEALESMAYWSLAQRIEYLARGLGECCVRFEWLESGGIAARRVMPHNVYVKTHPDDPMRAIVWAELRVQTLSSTGKRVYVWDVFDVSDPQSPTFKVLEATNDASGNGAFGEDLTATFHPKTAGDYPWVKDGKPFIPAVTYHSVWTGSYWNPSVMRGVYHGTLNAITFSTFTAHSAHAASGSTVIVSGLNPIRSGVDNTTDGNEPISGVVLPPGTMLYHDAIDGNQPMVTEVGPGSNLAALSEFTQGYSSQMLTRSGLSSPDAQRTHANPSSGAALYISNKDKREASKRIEPSFRRTDLEMAEKVAAMIAIQTRQDIPTSGYSITYVHPSESPQEESDRRADIDWKISRGMMSRIDGYIELHPGTTREAAVRALVQAARDEQELNALIGNPEPQREDNNGQLP